MGLLQDKFAKYDLPQQFMAKGVYPYFRTLKQPSGYRGNDGWQKGPDVRFERIYGIDI